MQAKTYIVYYVIFLASISKDTGKMLALLTRQEPFCNI